MSYLWSNIRHLRKQNALTQNDLAQKLGIKRSLVGAYEEQRAEPKIATIRKLSTLFELPIDTLLDHDLTKSGATAHIDTAGRTLRILPIVTTPDDRERITVVPVSAAAGYADTYGDPEYIGTLPTFSLPLQELYQDATYRLFQIHGDSMLPVAPKSYIISSYVEDWLDIRDGHCYIIVTRSRGVVFKRVWNRLRDRENLLLKSDNTFYAPYEIEVPELLEVWKAVGYISFEMPEAGGGMQGAHDHAVQNLALEIAQLKQEILGMRRQIAN